jgi:hypothetical protein
MIKLSAVGAAALLALSAVASMAPAVPAKAAIAVPPNAYDPRDFSGVWFQQGASRFYFDWTPEYAAIDAARKAAMAAGNPYQPAGTSCLPRGLVGMLTSGAYPLEIFQTPTRIVINKENGGMHRIYLNRGHLSEDDLTPLFFGDSVAKWEGNTLVVDSISLGATDNIDGQAPHSDAMTVVQKFRRTGPTSMEIEVTVTDPLALKQPAATVALFNLRPEYELQEYYCVNERHNFEGAGTTASNAVTPAGVR